METAFELANEIRLGRKSAAENLRPMLDRMAAQNPQLNAFLSIAGDRAMARAKQIDTRRGKGESLGPLAGVPIAIKDNICTSFGSTTCASRILEPFHSIYDAHVVELLEAAGAIIVGKTNLDEFAMGGSTENSAFGPTHNPWDLSRVAGGSSGGSAAAVAARLVPLTLGSDTGGSIRLPASFCGVCGLKPTYGRVSRYGLVAFGSSLDQIGPFATDIRDIALVMNVIAGHDRRDSTSIPAATPNYLESLNKPLKGMRIGLSDEYFAEGLDPQVKQAVMAAVQLMGKEGAAVVPVEFPHLRYAIACYYIIATAEASSNLARYDGVHYGHRCAKPKDYIDVYESSRGEGFGPEVTRRIMLGTYVLSSGYYDAYYLKALKVRTLIKADFDRAFEKVDLLVSPVAPTTAFRIGEKSDNPLAMYLVDINTTSANLAGVCGISIPCGFDNAGLPIGLQLMGPPLGEEKVLAAAHQYQMRTDFHGRTPPEFNGH